MVYGWTPSDVIDRVHSGLKPARPLLEILTNEIREQWHSRDYDIKILNWRGSYFSFQTFFGQIIALKGNFQTRSIMSVGSTHI